MDGDSVMGITEIILLIPQVIGIFAVIARFTENKSDDKVVQFLLTAINVAGMNTGKAKNAD
jgi:hypothetical protein